MLKYYPQLIEDLNTRIVSQYSSVKSFCDQLGADNIAWFIQHVDWYYLAIIATHFAIFFFSIVVLWYLVFLLFNSGEFHI